MTPGALTSLVRRNVGRSRKNFLMSAIGIVVGISTFVFFIGLGEGIKEVVLGKIFLVDQVEVVRKKFDTGLTAGESILGIGGSRMLDQSAADDLAAITGVLEVFPKMKLTFPAAIFGGKQIFGREMWGELLADGIEQRLVQSELEDPSVFRDLEIDITCQTDDVCPAGRTCQNGNCSKLDCEYNGKTRLAVCPGDSYCAKDTKKCETPIPVVISNHLLEIYNGSLATALGGSAKKMPKLSQRAVLGIQMNLRMGKSMIARSKRGKVVVRRAKIVGFSDRAITVGMTMPIEYVRRLNQTYTGGDAGSTYHSVILKVSDQSQVPQIVKTIREMGFELADQTDNAEKAANIIKTVESVFALVSFVILALAAINISQMFFMIIYQRKREIGVLRAVGASRNDVRLLILGEATVIGLLGGILGTSAGFGASKLADYVAARLPEFPYKPETFFAFPPWVWVGAIGGAVIFCLFGAFFPANAAARQQPAAALTQ